jgi:hypothetical protein
MTVILNSKHTIPVTNGGAVGSLTTSQLNGTSVAWPNSGAGLPLTVGTVYTSTGTGTANWTTTPSTQFNSSNGKPIMTVPNGKDEVILEKDATLTVKGKVVINDRDLEERLDTIEKVLQIPERDVKLEKKHPKLKKLYDEYIAALGKYRTFEAIKGE